eukprot:CAMPEP_0197417044 /NCGR_PEP_ID=MMETSP1170-20131217/3198_1 /TAXON_ID=54406 /ORGANISM="Sarcinochrysis sp, Strain CCMP770" /LENGTH=97 /DNA_ID=CAMNT_0042943979 /DNA_START=75 /DNA_END=369 /DNA_ORIENTATION=+
MTGDSEIGRTHLEIGATLNWGKPMPSYERMRSDLATVLNSNSAGDVADDEVQLPRPALLLDSVEGEERVPRGVQLDTDRYGQRSPAEAVVSAHQGQL